VARPKQAAQLRRRRPQRQPYDRVLIACEDTVATPRYLDGLIRHLGISSANIEIAPHQGSAPRNVVEAALAAFSRDPDFDQVYCVFDKDTHPTYDEARQRIATTPLKRRKAVGNGQPVVFDAVPSVPCFEFWLLLHFKRTTAPMPRCADVLPHLKANPGFAHYNKGSTETFALTADRLDAAIQNANHVNAAAKAAGTDNPTTRMSDLVERLRAVRDD
jgi:hypothetical protein